jgi:hypothetical protein
MHLVIFYEDDICWVLQAVFMLLTALIMRRGASTVFLSIALGLGGLTWAG